MNVLILSCSLNPDSRSASLGRRAGGHLQAAGHAAELIDLRTLEVPFCDGCDAHEAPAARMLRGKILDADAVVMAVPIYNYDVNAAAKNVVELAGKAWSDKVVGFLCAAGGRGSYMSVMALANSLMLDFRCLIVPRFVYATDADFDDAGEPVPGLDERIGRFCDDVGRIAGALRNPVGAR